MAWNRGTESPMDTSPAGPRKRSIFDTDGTDSTDSPFSSKPVFGQATLNSNIPFLFHLKPGSQVQEALADVEMASVTPPSHKMTDRLQAHQPNTTLSDQDHQQDQERAVNNTAVSRVRRERKSTRSKKSKANALILSGSKAKYQQDSDAELSDDQDSDGDDQQDHIHEQNSRSQSRNQGPMRSMKKYATNYLMPHHSSNLPNLSVHHMDWPELLLAYAQFLFNASILGIFLYLLYCVVRTVQQDVAEKVRGYEMDILNEISACVANYEANRCGTEMQAPALAAACKNWERCSARDPAVVGRARVTAETFAEILNGFVDIVSWKSMLFSLVALSIVVGATNSTLSFFRIHSRKQSRAQLEQTPHHHHHQHSQQQQHQLLPPSNGYAYPAYPPHPHHYLANYPGWSLASPPVTPARKRLHVSSTQNDETLTTLETTK